jgi:Domain of unknown function (DUF2017)
MFERAPGGGVALTLSSDERALLVGLTAELRSLLEGETSDPSLRRLFPPAYEDERQQNAYRELTGEGLLGGRREALELLASTAERDSLTAEEADAWLRALNDLRLVLGTRLDVQEDTFAGELRPTDPRTPAFAVYGYLSWMQEELIEALSPG